MTDYEKFVLGDYEQELFDRFRDSDQIQMTRTEFEILRKKGLVEGALSGNSDWFDLKEESGIVQLSGFGKGLRAFQKKQRKQEEKEDRRYKTSTRLSILAIVISLLALGLQFVDMLAKICIPGG